MRSRPVKRIADVRGLRAAQFIEDAGPLAHPVRPETYKEINNFYTSTVYEKGAEVVRMVQTLIGAEKFRAGMDLYFARHDGQAATVEQFIQCFADASGRDMTQFMRWYQPGRHAGGDGHRPLRCRAQDLHARLQANRAADARPADQRADGDSACARPGRQGWPRSAAYAGGRRNDRARRAGARASRRRHSTFTGIAERPVLSINRGFSAPIKLDTDLDRRRSRLPRRA